MPIFFPEGHPRRWEVTLRKRQIFSCAVYCYIKTSSINSKDPSLWIHEEFIYFEKFTAFEIPGGDATHK